MTIPTEIFCRSKTASAPRISSLSRLNGWPVRSPTDASPTSSRMPAHGSGADAVRYSFIVVDLHHLLLAGLPARLCENRVLGSNLTRVLNIVGMKPLLAAVRA